LVRLSWLPTTIRIGVRFDWRVIVLDSLLAINEPEGWVGSTQRSWLQKFLAREAQAHFDLRPPRPR